MHVPMGDNAVIASTIYLVLHQVVVRMELANQLKAQIKTAFQIYHCPGLYDNYLIN